MFQFDVLTTDPNCRARCGCIKTTRGAVNTPVFMPVGTAGSVKALSSNDLKMCSARIILGNTYHLYLRPGVDVLRHMEGLHSFIGWDRPLLTDSGGFQFFSLAKLAKFTDEGVLFQSHLDGSKHFFSPEKAVEIQMILGSDIMMSLDHCIGHPAEEQETLKALEKTTMWARRGFDFWRRRRSRHTALFGIVQGGMYRSLRTASAEQLCPIDFSGFAVGGLSVGEPKEKMYEMAAHTLALLPDHKPKYVMGVGTPEDLVALSEMGADMFDCVMPSRNARNGQLFTPTGTMNISNRRFAFDKAPIDTGCTCYTCLHYSRAYLRHLYKSRELLAYRLNTIHNIHHYLHLMKQIREAIKTGTFTEFKKQFYQTKERRSYDHSIQD